MLALEWRLGMQQAHDHLAEPGTAQITLRNEDQRYSPEITPIQPGQVLRIQSDDGTTLRTHFSGHILSVEPQPGDQGPRRAVIRAADAAWQMQYLTIRLPPQVDVRADDVIEQILAALPLRRTKLKGYWLLGRVDHGELGSNTRLPIANIVRSLESGQTRFAYVGDTWGAGIPAPQAIREVVEAEGGRFFIDRSGQAIFYNRHHLPRDSTALACFDDSFLVLEYAYGAQVVSLVQVSLLPRSVGSPGSTVWELAAPQLIPAEIDLPRQILARFQDEQGQPLGALDLMPPVPGLDYSANTKADGSGSDVTAKVDVRLRQSGFSAALLELRNRYPHDVYLQAGARLRGTPVIAEEPLQLQATSYGSLALYSPQLLRLNLPALDSIEQADLLAHFELSRRKTPRGELRSLSLDNVQQSAQILARTLFDRISVSESQTGHSADYFIVAEAHQVDRGGSRHRVTWTLESAQANQFWLLDHSLLGQTTVLAY